jgi:hypothetical protein
LAGAKVAAALGDVNRIRGSSQLNAVPVNPLGRRAFGGFGDVGRGVWTSQRNLLDSVVGSEILEAVENSNRPKEGTVFLLTLPVLLALLGGLIVGGGSMAMWAARRICDESARQFDRGFERGRWLADITTSQSVEPVRRPHRMRLLLGSGDPSTGWTDAPDAQDPPSLLVPQGYRPADPRNHAGVASDS